MPQRENAFVEIITTALGYFAVMFLLQLVAVLNIGDDELNGIKFTETLRDSIVNFQNAGLLAGALAWGWLAGLKGWGRVRVLFFAVMFYSFGAFLNGFAWSEAVFKWSRFLTAVGMAGELCTGLALVYETLNRKKWGLSAGVICAVAFLSPYLTYYLKDALDLPINRCFFVGGVLGLFVLLLRVSVEESPLFVKFVFRGGDAEKVLWPKELEKFFFLFLLGLQTHLIVSVLVPEMPGILPDIEPPKSASQLMGWYFPGHIVSSLLGGWLLDRFEDRKTVFQIFGLAAALAYLGYFTLPENGVFSSWQLRACLLGLANGVWVAYIVVGVEAFPIGIRALAAAMLLNGSRVLALIFDNIIMGGEHLADVQNAVLACLVVVAAYWFGLFRFFGMLKKENSPTAQPKR